MNALLSAALVLLPVPLLVFPLVSGQVRRCPMPFVAVAGTYLFLLAGSPRVISDPLLYSDTYLVTLLIVVAGCYLLYALVLALGKTVEVDYSEIGPERSLYQALVLCTVLWSYSVAIFVLYVSRHGWPPLFALFSGPGYINLYAVRAEKTTSIAEGSHWYVLGLQTVPYFIVIYSYVLKRLLHSRPATLLFAFNTIAALAFATSFANKDVLLHLSVFILLVRLCVGREAIRFRTALLYGLAGLGSVYLFLRIYLLNRGALAVLGLFGGYLVERLMFVYTVAHAYIVNIFPREHPFFDGTALANPGGLLPYTPVQLSRYLGYRVLGHLANYSTPAVSNGYANFGVPGVLLVLGVMIAQIVLVQAVFRRLPRAAVFASLYVLLVERAIGYGATSIQNVLAEELVLFCGVIVFLHYGIAALLSGAGAPARRLATEA